MKIENSNKWFNRKVQKGTKLGQKIGYPTLNFNVGNFGKSYNHGVYSCEVKIGDRIYESALYFGPKLNGRITLEIYVIGFSKKIYGQFIQFRLLKKIRNPKIFDSLDDLKKQIQKDLLRISAK